MNYILSLALFLSLRPALRAQQLVADFPRVFLLDAETLWEQKQRPSKELVSAVRDAADRAMKEGPFSVMDKDKAPPSGDKHDYMSQGPYWWPNPETANGLPYVRRDGQHNPETEKFTDHDNRERMQRDSRTLALAFYLTGNEAYAARAALLLRTWFLEPKTRMNPNLNFGQGIPGITAGRGTGIIETAGLTGVVDAVGLLAGSKNWTAIDQKGMTKWFADYLSWLQHSSNGHDEATAKNNHGTFYDVQVADFALFVGQIELAREIIKQSQKKRLAQQVMPDGSQPLEAARTRGLSYSIFNLRALMELAQLAEYVHLDLWNFRTQDGRSIRRALDFLLPFATGDKTWEYQQITEFKPQELVPLLLKASIKFHAPEYGSAARKIGLSDHDVITLLLDAELRAETTKVTKARTR